jgi:hypothetical protein
MPSARRLGTHRLGWTPFAEPWLATRGVRLSLGGAVRDLSDPIGKFLHHPRRWSEAANA